ncbi:type 4a pilus biogenesis protein PilO [Vibrio rhizosphaerae]|uniref:Type 4a pilus biogenesis protein PilO n=1 Tax=Vibrio rhizosphaerae TaxID=398736 RepID=A0ABU4IQI1_9VIBR|nr:type 4a pilus biogenesis protein PilO [Vibrio rhizosphaerae]MDW6091659.1 type 4a pilus biogenesis protein PilO [Vibrio rhizosphaerae]
MFTDSLRRWMLNTSTRQQVGVIAVLFIVLTGVSYLLFWQSRYETLLQYPIQLKALSQQQKDNRRQLGDFRRQQASWEAIQRKLGQTLARMTKVHDASAWVKQIELAAAEQHIRIRHIVWKKPQQRYGHHADVFEIRLSGLFPDILNFMQAIEHQSIGVVFQPVLWKRESPQQRRIEVVATGYFYQQTTEQSKGHYIKGHDQHESK